MAQQGIVVPGQVVQGPVVRVAPALPPLSLAVGGLDVLLEGEDAAAVGDGLDVVLVGVGGLEQAALEDNFIIV